jgi:uncharacterized membrane protein
MPIEINIETEFDAPVETAFAYTADYRRVPDWLYGISKFQPVGEKDYGLGATFDGWMNLGVTLKSVVEIDEFDEGSLIGMNSIKGFRNWSRWNFSAVDPATSKVRADFFYELPGGLAGKAIGKAIEPFVKIAVKHSSEALKTGIEAAARG